MDKAVQKEGSGVYILKITLFSVHHREEVGENGLKSRKRWNILVDTGPDSRVGLESKVKE